MKYRIEFSDNKLCRCVDNREEVIEWLKVYKAETISDIRKVYKNGVSDSVIEKYQQFLK